MKKTIMNMLNFKSSFVTSFLIIISNIHYVFAEHPVVSCRTLLVSEGYFYDVENGGLLNFISAYQDLTLYKIEHVLFDEPTDRRETELEVRKRLLCRSLTRSYFERLFENGGIDVSDREDPFTWCRFEVFGPYPIIYDLTIPNQLEQMAANPFYSGCVRITTSMLRNRFDVDNKPAIFQTMYEDWDLESVRQIGSYAMRYFGHFGEVLLSQDPRRGNIKTVEQFCEEEGHYDVTGYRYNL